MRRIWHRAVCVTAMLIGVSAHDVQGAGADPAGEEAWLMARRLVEENLELRSEIAELRAERDGLLARLAGEQYASDRLQVVPERLPDAAQGQVDIAPAGWMVVDASQELGLIALNGGARDGLRSGLSLAVLREGAVVARIKIVEVRERIAAGRVEALADSTFPQEGDRVVVWRARRE